MNMVTRADRKDIQEFWTEHVRRWKDSGLSQTGYCREHGLKLSQLHYWKSKCGLSGRLRLVSIGRSSDKEHRREGKSERNEESGLQVSIGGTTIKVAEDFNAKTLKRLLEILRG